MPKNYLSKLFNSMKKYTFISYLLITIILISAIITHLHIVSHQNEDSIRINLSGRQRMLTQKMSKEIMQYSIGIIGKNEVLLTMKVFDETLSALTYGGAVPLDLTFSNERILSEMEDQKTKNQLIKVINLWKPFKAEMNNFLVTKDPKSFDIIMKENVKILTEMNKSVFMMQHTGESNNRQINILLYIIYFSIVIILLLMLKRKFKLLRNANVHIKQLEAFLPICSNCKKMREPEMDAKDPKSWVPIEQYIVEHSESQFSHGVCPTCWDKLYGDL